jgi:RimJ/RimL family protein N-acetyltransferase
MDLELRRTLPADIPYVLGLEREDANRPFIVPWPEERHRAALDDPDLFHAILQGKDREGFLIVLGLTSRHRSVEFRRLVVQRKGRGIGRAALRLLKRMAFREWQAHRLWLDVKTHNERARALYLSEGFREEGLLRECLKTGDGYESVYILSMLESEYPDEEGLIEVLP